MQKIMNLAWQSYRQNYQLPGFYRVGFNRCLSQAHKLAKLSDIAITEGERRVISALD